MGPQEQPLHLSESQLSREVVQDISFSLTFFVSGHFTLLKIIEDYGKLLLILGWLLNLLEIKNRKIFKYLLIHLKMTITKLY